MLQMNTWTHAWVVLIIIFAGGLLVGKLSEKIRIPDVAAYLVYGIVVGPMLLRWVSEPSQSQVNQFVLNLGATLILFDGGRSVALSVLRRVWVSVSLLATLGVFVTAGIVGVMAHWVLGGNWIFSLLIGAVIASTDPATLIPVFKRVSIFPQLRQTVESESAFNDATGTVLVFTLLAASATGVGAHIQLGSAALTFIQSAGIGLVVGVLFGTACIFLVSERAWGVLHDYGSFVMMLTALSAYEVSTLLGASGFMAAFAAGVISGNGKTFAWPLSDHTEANVHHFGNAITLIMRMLIFVLLGTQVDFGLVFQYLWPGLAIVGVLMLVARPATVLSCVLADRRAQWKRQEVMFMFWVRETGVIPAALSGMLVAEKFPGASIISAVTFMAILLTIVIQASTTGIVAARLGVVAGDAPDEDI